MTGRFDDKTERSGTTLSAAFLGFLKRGELRVARDREGRSVDFLKACGRRDAGLEWIRASGRASLASFVVYHRQYHPDFAPPYNVALVALEEGPHLVSTVMAPAAQLKLGMALVAAFDKSGLLVFMPVESGHA